jgi:hypothetical protein
MTVSTDCSRISRSVTGCAEVELGEDSVLIRRSTIVGMISASEDKSKKATYCHCAQHHGSAAPREQVQKRSSQVSGTHLRENWQGKIICLIIRGEYETNT